MLLPTPVQDYLLSLSSDELHEFLGEVAAYTAEKIGKFVTVCADVPPKPVPMVAEWIDQSERGEIDSAGDFEDIDWLSNLPTY